MANQPWPKNSKLPPPLTGPPEMQRLILTLLCATAVTTLTVNANAEEQLKALIIDGQNNHAAWPKTTAMMKKYLEESGRFTVDVERTQFTWKGGALLKEFSLKDGKSYQDLPQPKPDPDFKPKFDNYDVVINNFGWNAAPWPDATNQAFDNFVRNGGGLVIVHAADNSFGDWPAYNKMIGLGGWADEMKKRAPTFTSTMQGRLFGIQPPAMAAHMARNTNSKLSYETQNTRSQRAFQEPGCMPKTNSTNNFVALQIT